jgi:hypothetical protein
MAACMIQPYGKGKKIADRLLNRKPLKSSKGDDLLPREPKTTYEQAFQQMKYMR